MQKSGHNESFSKHFFLLEQSSDIIFSGSNALDSSQVTSNTCYMIARTWLIHPRKVTWNPKKLTQTGFVSYEFHFSSQGDIQLAVASRSRSLVIAGSPNWLRWWSPAIRWVSEVQESIQVCCNKCGNRCLAVNQLQTSVWRSDGSPGKSKIKEKNLGDFSVWCITFR